MNSNINRWVGECLRKKKLKESWANKKIAEARREGTTLRKYFCPHCQHWHLTSQPLRENINEKK